MEPEPLQQDFFNKLISLSRPQFREEGMRYRQLKAAIY
jgi:hypothetical protein